MTSASKESVMQFTILAFVDTILTNLINKTAARQYRYVNAMLNIICWMKRSATMYMHHRFPDDPIPCICVLDSRCRATGHIRSSSLWLIS